MENGEAKLIKAKQKKIDGGKQGEGRREKNTESASRQKRMKENKAKTNTINKVESW